MSPDIFRPTRLAALLLTLGIGLGLANGAARAEPLPAVVDKVLLQQPSVRSAQALLRAAEAQITQVRSDFLPSLGLSYRNADSRDETQGRPLDRNIRRSDVSIRWNIFNGATDTNRLRAAGFTRDAADADLDNVLEQVANVCQTTVIQDAWSRGQPVAVHGWIYGIKDGLLHDLDLCISGPDQIPDVYRAWPDMRPPHRRR